jgi:hypothetical protein
MGAVAMYLRIARARFDPASADEVVEIFRELDGAMRRLPGLRHYSQGMEREVGIAIAVSVWETAEQAQFPREALGEPLDRLRQLDVSLEPLEVYPILDLSDVPHR